MRNHDYDTAMGWRGDLARELMDIGHEALVPGMTEVFADGQAFDTTKLTSFGMNAVQIDYHMVSTADYLVVNLGYAKNMPIGSLAEISWAYALQIPVILVGDNQYVKEPFVQAQAMAIVPVVEDVLDTLARLEGEWT